MDIAGAHTRPSCDPRAALNSYMLACARAGDSAGAWAAHAEGERAGVPPADRATLVALALELLQARHQARVRLQRCNGVSGRGVADGFSWLCQNVGAQATVQ